MSNVTPAAAAARESARTSSGKFGKQTHAAPETPITEPASSGNIRFASNHPRVQNWELIVDKTGRILSGTEPDGTFLDTFHRGDSRDGALTVDDALQDPEKAVGLRPEIWVRRGDPVVLLAPCATAVKM